ncbi:MAG: hypothetical protein WC877_00965 [Dehalococcoidales bacterium]|jgi:hypothetical protein
MTEDPITINFTFDELAGLYFIANAGLISVIMNTMTEKVELKNPDEDAIRYRETEVGYRENILAFRENENTESVLVKLDNIRECLAKASEESKNKPQ